MIIAISLLSFCLGLAVQSLATRKWQRNCKQWMEASNAWEVTAKTLLKSSDYWRTRARKLEADSLNKQPFGLS